MAGYLNFGDFSFSLPSFNTHSESNHISNPNTRQTSTSQPTRLPTTRAQDAVPRITHLPALELRQNSADCSNAIVAAVNSVNVAASRSIQQIKATADQAVAQASISASAAIERASASASNALVALSGSSLNAVSAASLSIASLQSSASVAIGSASARVLVVRSSASSAVAEAQAVLAAATGSTVGTVASLSASSTPTSFFSTTSLPATTLHKSVTSSSTITTPPRVKQALALTPAQFALIIIGTILISIFITLIAIFLVVRHRQSGSQSKDRQQEDAGEERPESTPRSLPIAASMRKREVDVANLYWPAPLNMSTQPPRLDVIHQMSAAVQESRSPGDAEDNKSFENENRGRPRQLDKMLPRQPNVLFIPVRTSSQQMRTVEFVNAEEVAVEDEEEETAFTVPRTVTRSASRSTSRNEGREEDIGVRTWVGAGGELSEWRGNS